MPRASVTRQSGNIGAGGDLQQVEQVAPKHMIAVNVDDVDTVLDPLDEASRSMEMHSGSTVNG